MTDRPADYGSQPLKAETSQEDVVTEPKHYMAGSIQPIDYINANRLDFNEGNVIKYVTRAKFKNGAEDIKKAIQYCKFILKYQYGISE